MDFKDFYSKLECDLKLGLAPIYVFYNMKEVYPNTVIEVNQKKGSIILNISGNKTDDISKIESAYNSLVSMGYSTISELNYRRSFG